MVYNDLLQLQTGRNVGLYDDIAHFHVVLGANIDGNGKDFECTSKIRVNETIGREGGEQPG